MCLAMDQRYRTSGCVAGNGNGPWVPSDGTACLGEKERKGVPCWGAQTLVQTPHVAWLKYGVVELRPGMVSFFKKYRTQTRPMGTLVER